MPKRSTKSSQDVQKLLDERRAVTQWLERLSLTGDDAADEVRSKVRADYETRLNTVSEELQGFRDELRDALSAETDKRDDLSQKERSADTRLAEAKLRHAVGEYEDSRWKEVHSEILGELVTVREELKVVGAEIARLADVLSAIDKRPDQDEPVEVSSEEERVSLAELDPEADAEFETLETEAELAEVEPGKDGGGESTRTSGQTDAFDELAFLKKVAPEGAGLRRRSGATFKPIDPTDLPEPTPGPTPDAPATPPEETPEIGPPEDDTAKKTLKCQECGAMNRPTEWYCESCGAELAAV
jgi:hypothetical protein